MGADKIIPISCLAAAAGLILAGTRFGSFAPILWWFSADLAFIAAAYALGAPRLIGGKRSDGSFCLVGAFFMLPYLLVTAAWWHIVRPFRSERPYDRLTKNITIGRRLLPREYPCNVTHVIDLTAEFARTRQRGDRRTYAAFPILDSSGLEVADMARLVQAAVRQDGIYIHCAAGHGRTGMVAACLLLYAGIVATAEEAMQRVSAVRPGAMLTVAQKRTVAAFARHIAAGQYSGKS